MSTTRQALRQWSAAQFYELERELLAEIAAYVGGGEDAPERSRRTQKVAQAAMNAQLSANRRDNKDA